LNAFIERWIQSLKYEALNHLIVFGKEHFDFIASEYVQYFLGLRPHQGLGNILLPRPRCGPADGASGDKVVSVKLRTLVEGVSLVWLGERPARPFKGLARPLSVSSIIGLG
jgi:hypothetical protein